MQSNYLDFLRRWKTYLSLHEHILLQTHNFGKSWSTTITTRPTWRDIKLPGSIVSLKKIPGIIGDLNGLVAEDPNQGRSSGLGVVRGRGSGLGGMIRGRGSGLGRMDRGRGSGSVASQFNQYLQSNSTYAMKKTLKTASNQIHKLPVRDPRRTRSQVEKSRLKSRACISSLIEGCGNQIWKLLYSCNLS